MKKITKTYEYLLNYMQKHSSKEYSLPLISNAVLGIKLDDKVYDASLLKKVKYECWEYMLGYFDDYSNYLKAFSMATKVSSLSPEQIKEYQEIYVCYSACEKAIKNNQLEQFKISEKEF